MIVLLVRFAGFKLYGYFCVKFCKLPSTEMVVQVLHGQNYFAQVVEFFVWYINWENKPFFTVIQRVDIHS